MRRHAVLLLLGLGLPVLLAGWISLDYTTESGAAWFAENRRDLLRLNAALLARPQITWVEPALRLQFIPNSKNFSADDLAAYREVEVMTKDLGVINIQAARVGSQIDGELITIRYLLKRRGFLFTSSDALIVAYTPNSKYLAHWQEEPGAQIVPLDVEGWYAIVDHDD
ncbi:hypothetical protein [Pelagibius sp. 7325]|uniref:hypothetical protein n=1 Tax=Pelagibius sp. 7325 TaxID=3131994 RepID=UPI0030EC32FD